VNWKAEIPHFEIQFQGKNEKQNHPLLCMRNLGRNDRSQTLIRKAIVAKTLAVGAFGDMGGFAPSIYKRGIRFINIPTTLPFSGRCECWAAN